MRNAGDLGYRDLYRKIVAGMMTLRDRGLAIFDLADVFKDEKGSIYETMSTSVATPRGRAGDIAWWPRPWRRRWPKPGVAAQEITSRL